LHGVVREVGEELLLEGRLVKGGERLRQNGLEGDRHEHTAARK
jgi:hypothetical protein